MKRRSVKILLAACLAITVSAAAAACGTAGSAENAKGDFPTDQTKIVGSGRMLTLKSGEPDVSLGEEGDVCLVAETGILYRKSAKGWQEAEFTGYNVSGSTLTVTYTDGTKGSYAMAAANEDNVCTHEGLAEAELNVVYPAKCVIPGIGVRYCAGCGEAFPEIIPAGGEHTYAEDGYICLDCGEANYFKDAELGGRGDTLSDQALYSVEGKYVIQTNSHLTTDFGATDGEVVIPGTIDGKEVVIGEMAFGSELKGANTTITSLVIEEGVKVIGQRAFQNCTSLESITLPESLTILGADPKDGSSSSGYLKIFAGCTSLREVHLGSKVTIIGNQAFCGCSSLTSIDLPQSLKEIHSGAFQGSGLTDVGIPESVEKIKNEVFRGCSNLTSFQFKKDTIIGNVGSKAINGISSSLFQDCTSLTQVTLPENIEEIGSSAFQGCSALTGIKIPANVTVIGDHAFQNCESIASLTFGEGSKLKSIGLNAFYCGGNDKPRNEKLQTVILPEGLETIGKTAFEHCSALESIVLPSTLTSLGSDKFDDYFGPFYKTKLTNVFYSGTQSDWESTVTNHDKLQFGDKLVYFSAEQQTGCWHWDGGVPKIWE